MVDAADRVVVAVSGGPDSICLLDVLHQLRDDLGMELFVAHFDHGLRPEEDEAETEFIRSVADSLSLPLETGRADLNNITGSSLEEQARHARYAFLEAVRNKVVGQKIAIGHTLNDQAETVIMRLLRGSGPRGLAGIPPHRRPGIIRPLLQVPRSQILAYVSERGLEWVTDSSNLEMHYLRNRIRGRLIPLLKEYQPRIVEILAQTGEVLRRDDELLEAMAVEWVKETALGRGDHELRIPVDPFLHLPPALKYRVLQQAILAAGGKTLRRIGFRHLEAIGALAGGKKPHAQMMLPHGMKVYRVYDHLVFSNEEREPHPGYRYAGTYRLDAVGATLCLDEMTEFEPEAMGQLPYTAYLDAEKLPYPLVVRNMRAGDRFVPLGMKGTKKLKDFFIDLKIPMLIRHRVPILTCRDNVVCICGMGIDDRYKVGPNTRRILRVSMRGVIG